MPELIAWAKDQTIEHRDEALAPMEIQPLRQARSESFVIQLYLLVDVDQSCPGGPVVKSITRTTIFFRKI